MFIENRISKYISFWQYCQDKSQKSSKKGVAENENHDSDGSDFIDRHYLRC